MPNRLFGKFISQQMKKAGLQQNDVFGEENQGYISAIQSGSRVPRSRKGIQNLAEALKFPDITDKFIDWLWALAIFGEDPREYFEDPIKNVPPRPQPHNIYLAPYTTNQDLVVQEVNGPEADIQVNMPEQDVLTMLGPPDKRIRIPSKARWVYDKFSLYIDFTEGRVTGIAFK